MTHTIKHIRKRNLGILVNFEENARTDANPIYNSNGLRDYPNARIHLQIQGFSKMLIHHITTQIQVRMDFLEVEFMKVYKTDNQSLQS